MAHGGGEDLVHGRRQQKIGDAAMLLSCVLREVFVNHAGLPSASCGKGLWVAFDRSKGAWSLAWTGNHGLLGSWEHGSADMPLPLPPQRSMCFCDSRRCTPSHTRAHPLRLPQPLTLLTPPSRAGGTWGSVTASAVPARASYIRALYGSLNWACPIQASSSAPPEPAVCRQRTRI